ncbi:hypothetical protein HN51_016801 [Arachis hypogaea]
MYYKSFRKWTTFRLIGLAKPSENSSKSTKSLSPTPSNTQTVAAESLSYGFKDFVIVPYGSYWKFMKKVCMLELLGGKMLHQLLHVRQQERKRFLSDLAKKGLVGEAVDIGAELMMLTNNVISMMTMRQKSCSERGEEAEALKKVEEDTMEL